MDGEPLEKIPDSSQSSVTPVIAEDRMDRQDRSPSRLKEFASRARLVASTLLFGIASTYSLMMLPEATARYVFDHIHDHSPQTTPVLFGMGLMPDVMTRAIDYESVQIAEHLMSRFENPQNVTQFQDMVEFAIWIDLYLRGADVMRTENPERIPVVTILKDAMRQYDGHVTWQQRSAYSDHNTSMGNIQHVYEQFPTGISDVLGYLNGDPYSNDRIHFLKSYCIRVLGKQMEEANDGYEFFSSPDEDYYDHSSGFAQRISSLSDRLEVRYLEKPQVSDSTTPDDIYRIIDESVIQELDAAIDHLSHQDGSRIQTSEVIAYFLRLNNGKLDIALHDTAIFYKFLARSYVISRSNDGAEKKEHFLAQLKHFADHFSLFARNYGYEGNRFHDYAFRTEDGMDKNYEIINQMGAPYHALGQVNLLSSFDVPTIQLAVLGQDLLDFNHQGHVKVLADIEVLNQLEEVRVFLRTLPSK